MAACPMGGLGLGAAALGKADSLTLSSPGTDWSLRLAARVPGPPWVAGALAVIFLACLSAAYRIFFDDPIDVPHGPGILLRWYFWFDLLNATMIAYLWIANVILHRGSLRDLASLQPILKLSHTELAELVQRITGTPRWILHGAGLSGAVLAGSMAFLDPGFWDVTRPDLLTPEMFFYTGRQAAIGWFAGLAIANEARATRGFAVLGGTAIHVELLDLPRLRPFAFKGLRPAAVCLIGVSLVSLFWLIDDTTAHSVGPITVGALLLSLFVFLYPMIPLRRAIIAEKERLLREIREAMRAEGDPLESRRPEVNARFASLVAYHGFVENTREWPVETPTVLRFLAFALLGLGSWLGGAIVEQLIDSVGR